MQTQERTEPRTYDPQAVAWLIACARNVVEDAGVPSGDDDREAIVAQGLIDSLTLAVIDLERER